MKPLSHRSPKAEVRESPIHGSGLFAREPIAAGEIVAVKGGHVLTGAEWKDIEPELGAAEIQVAEDLFLAPTRVQDRAGAMIFSNHSCEPNVALQGQVAFVAMRDVEAGEELTHDWATTDDGDHVLACHCGTAACRGRVTGKDWMKPELQERYRGWFCWFLQRKIDALGNESHDGAVRAADAPSRVPKVALRGDTPSVALRVDIAADHDDPRLDEVKAILRTHNVGANPHFLTDFDERPAVPIAIVATRHEAAKAGRAEAEATVAGGLIGRTRGPWLLVEIMGVRPELRRRGLGRRLLDAAEAEARRRGCTHAFLDTMAHQGPAFYSACGYRRECALPDWDGRGHAKLFFTKPLAPPDGGRAP